MASRWRPPALLASTFHFLCNMQQTRKWTFLSSINFCITELRRILIQSSMAEEKEEEEYHLIPKPEWVPKLISFQADIIYNSIMTLLSPLLAFLSTAGESYRRSEEATATVGSAVLNVPSKVTHGSMSLLRRVAMGVLGAFHAGVVSTTVMLAAVVVGVWLVRLWVEEPVVVRERLFFDYTDPNPKALFVFRGKGVPAGHTFHVSLVLTSPESDYNRQVGVFQVTAELVSGNGSVLGRSSRPCMLIFRSFPIRLIRTFLMGMPLILGITEETQTISIRIMNHREVGYRPRAKAIRMTLIPRAGTPYLPELYDSEIVITSSLPWAKQLIRSWKWTFYVWSSIYTYLLLVILLISFCRPLLFPFRTSGFHGRRDEELTDNAGDSSGPKEEDMETEMMRKWREKRRKRKAVFLMEDVGETAASMNLGYSMPEEETGDSESVCLGQ